MTQPTITTDRLTLRVFNPSDAAVVQHLAGDRAIADTTLNVPHPYEDGMAEEWIASLGPAFEAGTFATYAVTLAESGDLVGAVSLKFDREANTAEVGYWIGRPYWRNGYATEATVAMLGYGFEVVGVDKIGAGHFARNPASGRVMAKAGMLYEGTQLEAVEKWGNLEDLVWYSVTRADWTRPDD